MKKSIWLVTAGTLIGCSSQDASTGESVGKTQQAIVAGCTTQGVHVTDLRADFRDIWKGQEAPATGKQASPNAGVQLDFDTAVQASKVVGSFTPVVTDGSCGQAIPANVAGSVLASTIWGSSSTNSSRSPQPAPLNVLARDAITGVVSAAGALAAGGDIALTGVSVNSTTRRPYGLIAGGKITLANGSVWGDVTYGVASTFPNSVTISGQKSLKPFDTLDAFENLTDVSSLVASAAANGTAVLTNNTLKLTGTLAGPNLFRVSPGQLSQATTIQISVPNGAGAIIDVTGANVSIQNKSITVSGATASSTLWNFAHATSLGVSGTTVTGSILAPLAKLVFASGGINGVVVARSFASPGSGTLQYAALDVGLLFGSSSATATTKTVALLANQPLQRGCAYEFSIPQSTVLNAGGACLSAPFGVTFNVVPNHLVPTDRELVDVQRDRATQTLQLFGARDGINSTIGDALTRYESAMGIAAADLVAASAPRPSFLSKTQLFTSYNQTTQGYPVVGYGYGVSSENGIFRSAVGKAMPNLPTFAAPTVSSATALQTVLNKLQISPAPWIAKPALYKAPLGQLVVVPTRRAPTAADFKLAWSFQLGDPAGIFATLEAQVDATSGAFIRQISGLVNVATFDPTDPSKATYQGIQASADVETITEGKKLIYVAPYDLKAGGVARTLASQAVADPGVLRAVYDATGAAYPTGSPVEYVTDPTPTTPWDTTERTEQRMASAYFALNEAAMFLSNLGLQVGSRNWSLIDGLGVKPVQVIYTENITLNPKLPRAFFKTSRDASLRIYINGFGPDLNVDPDAISHEFGHGLGDSMREAMGLRWIDNVDENGSISEGIADLYAMGTTQPTGLAAPWYSLLMNEVSKSMPNWRDARDPKSSVQLDKNKAPGAPEFYLADPHYANYPVTTVCDGTNDGCGTHINSTIVSHWGYLMAVGGSNASRCGLYFDPLDPDLTTSLKMAINVAFRGFSSIAPDATFTEFRNATVVAAQQLQKNNIYPNHPKLVSTVRAAWDAVGLPFDTAGATDVSPPDNAAGVEPWVTFRWQTSEFGSPANATWDLQLSDSPDFATVIYTNTTPIAKPSFKLALPFVGATTYYWRVRPHASGAWAGSCYPVHSFTTSGNAPKISKLEVLGDTRTPNDSHKVAQVHPGQVEFRWSNVTGVDNYAVSASTPTDRRCAPVAGDLTHTAFVDIECLDDKVCLQQSRMPTFGSPTSFQPNKHYWLDVLPVGPPDINGAISYGECKAVELDTIAADPPVLLEPADGKVLFDGQTFPFTWLRPDGIQRVKLEFFPLNENGDCNTSQTPAHSEQVVGTTATSNMLPRPLNLAGYCWRATGISDDGQPTALSAKRKFRYQHVPIHPTSPGVPLASAISVINNNDPSTFKHGDPSPLPGDSYGSDVTFEWPRDPQASGYHVQYGRWEPLRNNFPIPLDSVDPPNCISSGSSIVLGAVPEQLSEDCQAPTLKLYDEETEDNFLEVPGTKDTNVVSIGQNLLRTCTGPSCGRYCWRVWPLFDNMSYEPFVNVAPHCYTSGPDKPVMGLYDKNNVLVTYTRNQPGDVEDNASFTMPTFSSDDLHGGVVLNYVPDGQWKVFVNDEGAPDVEIMPLGCPNNPPVGTDFTYRDQYACSVEFKLHPHENRTYKITAQVFNSDNVGPPVMDDTTKVFEISITLITGTCGDKENAGCCKEHPRCDVSKSLGCNGARCVKCGHQNEECCEPESGLPGLCYGNLVCGGGGCQPCGGPGGHCCVKTQACHDGQSCGEDGLCPQLVPPQTPNCPASLAAPQLTQKQVLIQGIEDCDESDLNAQAACLVAGGPDQLCDFFTATVPALEWSVVPDATHYEIIQIGQGQTYKYELAATAANSQGRISVPVTTLTGVTPTVDASICPNLEYGYFVAVTALNKAGGCTTRSGTSLTAIGKPLSP